MDLDKKIEAILFWKGEPMKLKKLADMFSVSEEDIKFGINTFYDGLVVTNSIAMETVLRVENTQDLALVYLNHSTEIKDTDVYVNDTFVETIKGGPLSRYLRIYPTTDEFVVRMGDRRTMKFNKNEILDPKNRSFTRLK